MTISQPLENSDKVSAVTNHYRLEKERYLEDCIICGLCAKKCPILDRIDSVDATHQEIQKGVYDCVQSGKVNDLAYTKAFACMECFKCTAGVCPKDLNPMIVNELVKGISLAANPHNIPYGEPSAEDSTHRLLASAQLHADEYARVMRRSSKEKAKIVFFPGCNVYLQPEKILSALDIFEAIGDDYAFLPGLDYCCGDSQLFLGDTAGGANKIDTLVTALEEMQPEQLVLWCPTCLCRFEQNILSAVKASFSTVSFPQYLASNMEKIDFASSVAKKVTLHEACKSAYTGLDLHGPRSVLQKLPGIQLVEMESSGKNSRCCGSGTFCWYPEAGRRMTSARLQEVKKSGAEAVVTVCHYCGQAFLAQADQYNIDVVNYISLVAEAMGIGREDKYKKYSRWGDVNRIAGDAAECIGESCFDRGKIMKTFESLYTTEVVNVNQAGEDSLKAEHKSTVHHEKQEL